MKIFIRSLVTISMCFILQLNVQGDVSFCPQPNLPTSMWQKLPDGIEVALALSTRIELGGTKNIQCLVVYVHNNSSKDFLVNQNFYDFGVQIFYVNGQSDVPLHPWENADPNEAIRNAYLMPASIKPGQTLKVEIDINPQELSLLKSYPVKCGLPIYGGSSRKKTSMIETTPQSLSEIPTK